MLISQFSTRIASEVQGAPSELIRQAVVDAAADFCTRSRAWNEIQDAVLVQVGVNDYEADLPSGAQPLSIQDIWCGTERLLPLTMHQLQSVLPTWQTAVGQPRYYNSEIDWDAFRVYPQPNSEGVSLRIRASFAPKESSDTLPDFLWTRYREVISSGAKARLLMKPKTAWFDPVLADFHEKRFETGVADARIAVLHGRVAGPLTVPSRRFF